MQHILHIFEGASSLCGNVVEYLTYSWHFFLLILWHNSLHILHILHIFWHKHFAYFAYSEYYVQEKSSAGVSLFISIIAWFPNPVNSCFTYHHLHPSLQSVDLLQEAPGRSADALCISYCIVPILPTGTKGNSLNMEDAGKTYDTCFDSQCWYSMVDLHTSNQAVH